MCSSYTLVFFKTTASNYIEFIKFLLTYATGLSLAFVLSNLRLGAMTGKLTGLMGVTVI